jgi:hypothetical protein
LDTPNSCGYRNALSRTDQSLSDADGKSWISMRISRSLSSMKLEHPKHIAEAIFGRLRDRVLISSRPPKGPIAASRHQFVAAPA